jgi:hypothetical protein
MRYDSADTGTVCISSEEWQGRIFSHFLIVAPSQLVIGPEGKL